MNLQNEGVDHPELAPPMTAGDCFFTPPEDTWGILSAIFAIVLFSAWASRSGLELTISIVIIASYSILSIIVTRFKFKQLNITQDQHRGKLDFIRSGLSWKYLFYCLLGSAIPILLPWFVLSNSIQGMPEISRVIMIIAMLILIGIHPIAPAIANNPRLPFLKTRLSIEYDQESSSIVNHDLQIHHLDGYWFSHQDDTAFLDALWSTSIALIQDV